jgi:hypothetical protein
MKAHIFYIRRMAEPEPLTNIQSIGREPNFMLSQKFFMLYFDENESIISLLHPISSQSNIRNISKQDSKLRFIWKGYEYFQHLQYFYASYLK